MLAVRHEARYVGSMANTNPKRLTTAFTMRVDQDFLDELEKARALRRPIPTRADLIRELVKEAATGKGKR